MAKRVYSSREQAGRAKEKAALFEENVLGDQDTADAIRDEGLDDWLARTKRRISEKNPKRREVKTMASKQELQAQLDDLQEYVEELESKLDQIADLSASEDEDGEDNGDD